MPAGVAAKMRRKLLPFLVIATAAAGLLPLIAIRAQSPAPLLVQAAGPAGTPRPAATPASAPAESKATLQLLQEMQATNAATIKKQEATLQALDALQQAADELKIFSKRG